jgi:hypothetical protein
MVAPQYGRGPVRLVKLGIECALPIIGLVDVLEVLGDLIEIRIGDFAGHHSLRSKRPAIATAQTSGNNPTKIRTTATRWPNIR